jgi:hypothetical protein
MPLLRGEFSKLDPEERLVFGWASVASAGGVDVVDSQADIIDAESLEKAMYAYVEASRVGGTMHEKMGTATLIEAFVSTPAKLEKMGLPAGALPLGVWVGYRVIDDDTWAAVKSGKLRDFSIGGIGSHEEIE